MTFNDYKSMQNAEKAMQQKIYRQDNIETNIYVIASIKKDEQIPEVIKVEYNQYDFIMI